MSRIVKEKNKLTEKELEFARVYALCNNSVTAYKSAYNSTSTNKKNLSTEASRLLCTPGIATEIARLKQESIADTKIELKFIYDELLKLYFTYVEKQKDTLAVKTIDLLCKYHTNIETLRDRIDILEKNMSLAEIEQKLAALKADQDLLKDAK